MLITPRFYNVIKPSNNLFIIVKIYEKVKFYLFFLYNSI